MISKALIISGAVLFAAIVLHYTIEQYGILGAQNFFGPDSPGAILGISMLIMLSGIVSGSIYRILKEARQVGDFRELVKMALTDRSFIMSILVSPMVFWAVYTSTGDNPLSGASAVLLYQNGFFCHVVFEQLFGGRYPQS